MGPREGRRVRDQERRQQDEREALGVQILQETLSSRPERHSGTPWGARNREEGGNPALHTPADVRARLQQEMSSTLRSIAEEETSEVIQIIRQEEAHVDRMASAGIDLDMLVESGQLRLAFPRVSVSPTVASAAPTSATSSGSSSTATTQSEPNLAANIEQASKQSLLPNRSPFPKST